MIKVKYTIILKNQEEYITEQLEDPNTAPTYNLPNQTTWAEVASANREVLEGDVSCVCLDWGCMACCHSQAEVRVMQGVFS